MPLISLISHIILLTPNRHLISDAGSFRHQYFISVSASSSLTCALGLNIVNTLILIMYILIFNNENKLHVKRKTELKFLILFVLLSSFLKLRCMEKLFVSQKTLQFRCRNKILNLKMFGNKK